MTQSINTSVISKTNTKYSLIHSCRSRALAWTSIVRAQKAKATHAGPTRNSNNTVYNPYKYTPKPFFHINKTKQSKKNLKFSQYSRHNYSVCSIIIITNGASNEQQQCPNRLLHRRRVRRRHRVGSAGSGAVPWRRSGLLHPDIERFGWDFNDLVARCFVEALRVDALFIYLLYLYFFCYYRYYVGTTDYYYEFL